MSAVAVETGTIVYVIVAALGLVAVVQASPVVFTVISLAGAVYLAWLGVKTLRSKSSYGLGSARVEPLGRVFREGVLVNLLNPKTALFFLAFLPQFTTRGGGPEQVRTEMLLLGLAVVVIALALDLSYALGADAIGRRYRSARGRRTGGWQRYLVGGIYLCIAAFAAVMAFH